MQLYVNYPIHYETKSSRAHRHLIFKRERKKSFFSLTGALSALVRWKEGGGAWGGNFLLNISPDLRELCHKLRQTQLFSPSSRLTTISCCCLSDWLQFMVFVYKKGWNSNVWAWLEEGWVELELLSHILSSIRLLRSDIPNPDHHENHVRWIIPRSWWISTKSHDLGWFSTPLFWFLASFRLAMSQSIPQNEFVVMSRALFLPWPAQMAALPLATVAACKWDSAWLLWYFHFRNHSSCYSATPWRWMEIYDYFYHHTRHGLLQWQPAPLQSMQRWFQR